LCSKMNTAGKEDEYCEKYFGHAPTREELSDG
jgi:hypothetical protein